MPTIKKEMPENQSYAEEKKRKYNNFSNPDRVPTMNISP